MSLRMGTWTAWAVVVLLVAGAAVGDTITLRDGRVLEGRIIRQDRSKVVFEMYKYGAKSRIHVPQEDIVKIERGKIDLPEPKAEKKDAVGKIADRPEAPPVKEADGPTFCVIPLHGEVGKTVVSGLLEDSLKDAARRKVDLVVLDVDSPGGAVAEAEDIIKVLRAYNRKLRIVTFAGQDLSAAAIISLGTKEIYMRPGGIIGAATAYRMSVFGIPAAVEGKAQEEKAQSAWRATARSAAETGGHSPLLAEAMIDADMELYWENVDGRKVVREGEARDAGEHAITTKGRLLTMTAGESFEYGLTRGIVSDYDELCKACGFTRCTEVKALGKPLAQWWAGALEKIEEDMNEIGRAYVDNMERANDLIQHRNTANYGGMPRYAQLAKWRQLTTQAVTRMRMAADGLDKAVEVTGTFEHTKFLHEYLKNLRDEAGREADREWRNRNDLGAGLQRIDRRRDREPYGPEPQRVPDEPRRDRRR